MSLSQGFKVYTVVQYDDYRKEVEIGVLRTFLNFDSAYSFVMKKRNENISEEEGIDAMEEATGKISELQADVVELENAVERVSLELEELRLGKPTFTRTARRAALGSSSGMKDLNSQYHRLHRELEMKEEQIRRLKYEHGLDESPVYSEGEYDRARHSHEYIAVKGQNVLYDISSGFRHQRLAIFSSEVY